jgi:hypothetical protein
MHSQRAARSFVRGLEIRLYTFKAYTQSHAGVHVSRMHLQEHVVDMCKVLISVPTSPDRTLGNAETPRENKIYAMDNVRLWCI